MQTYSTDAQELAKFNAILAADYAVKCKIKINDYLWLYEDDIVSVSTSIDLLDGGDNTPCVGRANSSQLDLEIHYNPNNTIPKTAKIELFIQLYATIDGTLNESLWIRKGIYYIDTRTLNYDNDSDIPTLEIHAYDRMLVTSQAYYKTDSEAGWPKIDTAVVQEIATAIGVTVEQTTLDLMDHAYTVQYPGYGDGAYTMREVLGYVGAMYAGNWIITDDGNLRLVQLHSKTTATPIAISTSNIGNVKISPSTGVYTCVTIDTGTNDDEGVEIVHSYPPDPESGNELNIYCPWGTAIMAQNIYGYIGNISYQPFEAESVMVTPLMEPGDTVSGFGVTELIFKREMTFGILMDVSISANNDSETEHEYPYITNSEQSYNRTISELTTQFLVQDGLIQGIISSYVRSFKSDTDPYLAVGVTQKIGDLWFCTADGYIQGRYAYKAKSWYRNSEITTWRANTSYAKGVVVTYNDTKYYAVVAHRSGTTFDASLWGSYSLDYYWAEMATSPNVAPDWEKDHAYEEGEYITYNGLWYHCEFDHTSSENMDYAVAYDETALYEVGDYCLVDSDYYICNTDIDVPEEFTTDHWDLTWTEVETISDMSESMIEQTLEQITLSVTSDETGSKVTLTKGEIEIESNLCEMHVDALNVDGDITAHSLIANAIIESPTIEGGTIKASDSSSGGVRLSSTGLNFYKLYQSEGVETEGNKISLGYIADTTYGLPVITLGSGIDEVGTDTGLIKKYGNGVWIGDSDDLNADTVNESGTSNGLFVDFTTGKVYKYESGVRNELTTPIARFG